MFASQSYEGDTTPDDLNVEALYRNHDELCAAILVFDIFIANCDRHAGNIKVDKASDPTLVRVFDHERSLFYIDKGRGRSRLKECEDRLGVTDGDQSRDEWHCLVEVVKSAQHILTWADRVRDIPDWFLKRVVEDVRKLPLVDSEVEDVLSFLTERQKKINALIWNNRKRFTQVEPTSWPFPP